MKCTDLPILLQKTLKKISYVTIATVSPNGQPWNTPVVGRFDDDLHLYWVSYKKSQHSLNIAKDPRIFVVVYDSCVPEGQGRGLYLQMRAQALDTAAAIAQARTIYDTSFFVHPFRRHKQFLGECPQRIYKAVLQRAWHNTEARRQDHFIDCRKEILT